MLTSISSDKNSPGSLLPPLQGDDDSQGLYNNKGAHRRGELITGRKMNSTARAGSPGFEPVMSSEGGAGGACGVCPPQVLALSAGARRDAKASPLLVTLDALDCRGRGRAPGRTSTAAPGCTSGIVLIKEPACCSAAGPGVLQGAGVKFCRILSPCVTRPPSPSRPIVARRAKHSSQFSEPRLALKAEGPCCAGAQATAKFLSPPELH